MLTVGDKQVTNYLKRIHHITYRTLGVFFNGIYPIDFLCKINLNKHI